MNQKHTPTINYFEFDLTDEEIDNLTFIVPDGAKTAYERNPRWNIFNIVEESEADVSVHVSEAPVTEDM